MSSDLVSATARAYLFIDECGQLAELADEISLARRDYREQCNNRTCGEVMYGDSLARMMRQHTGISEEAARNAIESHLRPDWTTYAFQRVIDFARGLKKQRVAT